MLSKINQTTNEEEAEDECGVEIEIGGSIQFMIHSLVDLIYLSILSWPIR